MRGQVRLVAAVVVAVTVGAAAVAFGVALLLGDIVQLRSTATATLRTGDYLAATINVERAVVDAETGLRGYVITGEELFLAPTIAAQAQLPQAARALERAASNEGAFLTRATALADSARAYMTTYVPRVTREVATHPKAARSVPTTALGKQLVDGIRTQTAQLEQLISNRQAARQRSARRSANHAVRVAVVVLIVVTGLTLALSGFLGWLLVGRERARERAAFLAESGALLDRGTTADEVLETFAKLALERGSAYCVAEELVGRDLPLPELEVGRVVSGNATIVSPADWPRAEAAWEQARLLAQTRRATATHVAVLPSPSGDVHVLALAATARRNLVARVLLARRGADAAGGVRTSKRSRDSAHGWRWRSTPGRFRLAPRRSTAGAITSRGRSSRASCPTSSRTCRRASSRSGSRPPVRATSSVATSTTFSPSAIVTGRS